MKMAEGYTASITRLVKRYCSSQQVTYTVEASGIAAWVPLVEIKPERPASSRAGDLESHALAFQNAVNFAR
jgi:hypothetical protein